MTAYDAVIFDLDGTLIDSERLVIAAGRAALVAGGHAPRTEVLTALVGTVSHSAGPALRAAYGPGFDVAAMEQRWEAEIARAFAGPIPLRPGVHELLDALDGLGLPRAIATNSRTDSALHSLAQAGLDHRFDPAHVHGRDRVTRPKPAPDLFLLAASGLGAAPQDCLVFEDSDTGTAAGLAAGMVVVQIPDQRPAGNNDAHHLASSLMEGARAAGLIR